MIVDKKEVEKELELRDPLDLVLLLAIGPKPASHLQVQKRALLISRVLGIDPEVEPYDYGLYSETITEKLQDARNEIFIRKRDKQYELTPEGRCAYDIIMSRLIAKKGEDIPHFIETIYRMNEKELLALTYHLFPESFKESKIKEEVLAMIKCLKSKGLVKVKQEGERITIEVEA